jgi:hypothetical protein
LVFILIQTSLVAKGQKMAMKNYAKQLNAQIEELVTEVRRYNWFFLSIIYRFFLLL